MKTNDVMNKEEIRAAMQTAAKTGNMDAFLEELDRMTECLAREMEAKYLAKIEEKENEYDSVVLSARGVRQLTTEEKKYYNSVLDAMRSGDPKQALNGLSVVLPKTVVDNVFEDLRTNHPLLSKIRFIPSGGAVEILVNTNGYEEAVWGELCDEIVKELMGGLKAVNTVLCKLSAFLPVCKAMLDLGPEWLDSFVREVLYEALANGLEAGIIDGDGSKKPIGMTRNIGAGVAVVDGKYPRKAAIKLTELTADAIGNILALLAIDANGKGRLIKDVIFLVHPVDYFQKVFPATTLQNLDGTYKNNVLPYPMEIIQSPSITPGTAVIGLGYRYLGLAGTSKDGKIEYSDHQRFTDDKRIYLIKTYANGMPLDNNAFAVLDISDLKPTYPKFSVAPNESVSGDATLAALSLGSVALSPAFAPETKEYTATTTNASNVIKAVPADASSEIEIVCGENAVKNGAAVTWDEGENIVLITVTAEDGTNAVYTVTVTKS